ncbi:hypothetical protein EYF80_060245 [Liparis tanakae]|uniref:Uncharacterized protein n=1 Tax=Liparis tanakae TaxID=230148 RepID=A0A4Z2EL45_9TELE|nr:hypothetical protein EYF80_060245 [Liparis tanakae]
MALISASDHLKQSSGGGDYKLHFLHFCFTWMQKTSDIKNNPWSITVYAESYDANRVSLVTSLVFHQVQTCSGAALLSGAASVI